MEKDKSIRSLAPEELTGALNMVWDTFTEQIAPQCTDEGIEEFWSMIDNEYYLHRMGDGSIRMWGAFDGERVVGLCAVRDFSHIMLLFIEPEYQMQGAGANLLKKAIIDCKSIDPMLLGLTVDTFPDSCCFFEALGFERRGDERMLSGMPIVPMELRGRGT